MRAKIEPGTFTIAGFEIDQQLDNLIGGLDLTRSPTAQVRGAKREGGGMTSFSLVSASALLSLTQPHKLQVRGAAA